MGSVSVLMSGASRSSRSSVGMHIVQVFYPGIDSHAEHGNQSKTLT